MADNILPGLLGAVMAVVAILAVGLSIMGPARVEQHAVEMFEGQQQLQAEQLADQISARLDSIARRLELPVVGEQTGLATADTESRMEQGLAWISHRSDASHGVTLFLHDTDGHVLAVAPGAKPARGEKFFAHEHLPEPSPEHEAVGICQMCMEKAGEVSVTRHLTDSRLLAANVDAAKLAETLFEKATSGRSVSAELIAADGRALFATEHDSDPRRDDWVDATAGVEGTDWAVRVRAPRATIAPQVNREVRDLLLVAGGLLVSVIVGIVSLFVWGRRRQREELQRNRAMAHQDKLATLGTLAASVAHEIRNGVTVAKANLQFAAAETSGTAREDVDVAIDAVDRLAALAVDLSGYAGKDSRTVSRFELSKVVDRALRIVEPKLKNSTTIEVQLDGDAPVSGNEGALMQVVVNLVLNAYDACNESRNCRIDVRVFANDDLCGIIVEDNGSGIAEEVAGQIFEPFFSTKGDGDEGGTGIGLWLCSQIVEQHGGKIDAVNKKDGGARFVVELPRGTRLEEPGTRNTGSRTKRARLFDA